MDITYAAHTASCTFLLDSEGICRRIVLATKGKRREGSRTAAKCVGAQYVASLDGSAAGGLVEMPRVGAAMLFARVDERGRVSLVRTGIVTSFESSANSGVDPFLDSGTVETSAPVLEPRGSVPAPRFESGARELRDRDDDLYDDDDGSNDRTQRIQALRPDEVAAALANLDDQRNDLKTAEYGSVSDGLDDIDEDYRPTLVPPSAASHRMLPRHSDPHHRAAAAAAAPRRYAPPAQASDVQVSRRRRRI
jgi:hypothetical protein